MLLPLSGMNLRSLPIINHNHEYSDSMSSVNPLIELSHWRVVIGAPLLLNEFPDQRLNQGPLHWESRVLAGDVGNEGALRGWGHLNSLPSSGFSPPVAPQEPRQLRCP